MPGVRGAQVRPTVVHRPLRVEVDRLLGAVDRLLVDGGREARIEVRPGIVELAASQIDGWSVVSLLTSEHAGPADVVGARGVSLMPLRWRLVELARPEGSGLPVVVGLYDEYLTIGDGRVAATAPGRPPLRPAPEDPPTPLAGLDENASARFLDPDGRVLRLDEAWTTRVQRFGPARFHGFAAAGLRYVQATAAAAGDGLTAALVMPAAVVGPW